MVERFRTISNLQRKPSVLSVLDPISEGRSSSCGRCSAAGDEVQSWEWGEVAAWLAEIGMTQYQVCIDSAVSGKPLSSRACFWSMPLRVVAACCSWRTHI